MKAFSLIARKWTLTFAGSIVWLALAATTAAASARDLPVGTWVQLASDPLAARAGSALRYVPEEKQFFLWGFMNADYDLLQEHPLMEIPEYDVVAFSLAAGRWENHFPREWEAAWKKKLPMAYIARTYAGKTTGVERSVLRGASNSPEAAARPDLNLVFDQVAYCPPMHGLFYFTGGLTAVYNTANRRWTDLKPRHSPPPVLAGSLVYNPLAEEMILFGGGQVVEKASDGKTVGYTGLWSYSLARRDWQRLDLPLIPTPRMNTRMVLDERNQVVVLFGGDSQTHYLADTWIFDLKSRTWRQSSKPGPPARAGHFSAYDPGSGQVVIGGGYNRQELNDMWGYDAATDSWRKLPGEVPTGFYLTADIAPDERVILLATSTKTPGDRKDCDPLYPVRTTYAYRLGNSEGPAPSTAVASGPIAKIEPATRPPDPDRNQLRSIEERLKALPVNRWVELNPDGPQDPVRTWGSAAFDTDRSRLLYWGGGHCGYEGNDADTFVVGENRWLDVPGTPEVPQRMYNSGNGSRLGGITFGGNPWVIHGRRIYAYDPVSKKMILARALRLTTGYEPEAMASFPAERVDFEDALVKPPSSYVRYASWSLDLETGEWRLMGPTPIGLDTFVTTPKGVVAIDQHWRSMLNDWGYDRDWRPDDDPRPLSVYRLDEKKGEWKRLGGGVPSPQNLYEQISLVYDSQRDRLLLHGGGEKRDELWAYSFPKKTWENLKPTVEGGDPTPGGFREAVYLPGQDVMLTLSLDGYLWVYHPAANAWRKLGDASLSNREMLGRFGHNRGLVYDPVHQLILLVAGRPNYGGSSLFALRYRDAEAK